VERSILDQLVFMDKVISVFKLSMTFP